jgi:hypothetical protein
MYAAIRVDEQDLDPGQVGLEVGHWSLVLRLSSSSLT